MKIKYNWAYDRYVTEDGKVFRYDSKKEYNFYRNNKICRWEVSNASKS